jgi:hypothetical protein
MMNLDKEKMIYAGVGLFVFLVLVNSTKKVPLNEVLDTPTYKSFDDSKLPSFLRPPKRLADGEPEPSTLAKRRNFTFGMMPRFDNT